MRAGKLAAVKDLQTTTPLPLEQLPAAPATLNFNAICERILSGEVTNEKLAMIKDLVAMDAERKFTMAFVALQKDLPVIVAQTVIPNRGKYERFEDVMDQIQPVLTRHHFTVSFEQHADDKRVTAVCHLRHSGGHATKTPYSVRTSGKADSETQADVKAATTAMRKALQLALNIVIRQDCLNEETDPRLEGGFVTEEQADELEQRVALLGDRVDREAFFKFAGAKRFREIPAGRYDTVDQMLRRKEK